MMILNVEWTLKPEKTAERNFTTFGFIFTNLPPKPEHQRSNNDLLPAEFDIP